MIQQMGESIYRSQVIGSSQLALSRQNPWARRPIKNLEKFDQFAVEAKKIEDKFESDTKNM